ncbi:MAG: hypothetical protein DRQ55_15880, partial [Planctomycetota bacterium]
MGDPAAVELLEACLKGQSADERLLVLGALGSIAVQRPDAAQGSDSAEALRLRERAAEEILDSLVEVVDRHPHYRESRIIERLVEPERIITFRVPWIDDQGRAQVNRGFRVEMNSAIGPYKG